MTWFDGKLEQRSQSLKDYQGARLRRLQEVRVQEKQMSLSRCDEYRKFIRFRKKTKTDDLKEDSIKEKRDHHDELAFARQSSLVDTGCAHRTASEISSYSVINNIKQKLLVNKTRAAANERGRIATIEGNEKLLARQDLAAYQISKINLRQSAIASDREDARKTAEARAAKVLRELAEGNLHPSELALNRELLKTKKLTQQGSNRIQDRGTFLSNVKIIRYSKPNEDDTFLMNNSAAEERSALNRRWTTVMKEMVHRKCSASRARVARNSLVAAHMADRIEAEILLLAAADKASCRVSVARSAAAVRSGARRREASQPSTVEFEHEFILPINTKLCLEMKNRVEEVLTALGDHDDEFSNTTAYSSSTPRPIKPTKPLTWEAADKLGKADNRAASDSDRRSVRRSYPVDAYTAGNTMMRSSPVVHSVPRPPPSWTVPSALAGHGDGAASRPLSDPDRLDATPLQTSAPWTATSPSYLDDCSYSSSGRLALSPSKGTPASDIVSASSEEGISLDEERDDRGLMSPALTVMRPQAAGHHAHPYLTSRSNQQLEALETSEIAEAAIRGTVASSSSTALKAHVKYVSSTSLSDLGSVSVSRSSSTTVRSEASSQSVASMRHSSEGDPRPYEASLGVTVRLRTVHSQSLGMSNGTQGGVSIDSFEAFFEDEDDVEGEADSLVPVVAARRFPSSSGSARDTDASLCVSVGSSRSSKSLSHSQGDSEGDDNMSAITWPDPTPKRTTRLEVQSGATVELRDIGDRVATNTLRNRSVEEQEEEEEEEEEEDCSIEGDGFLHELDALSYFWAQRRKGIQSKASM